MEDYPKAKLYIMKVIDAAVIKKRKLMLFGAYSILQGVYRETGKTKDARIICRKMLTIAENNKDSKRVVLAKELLNR